MVHRLSRLEARRIAVRAQLLDAPRPANLLDLIRHLGLVQIDTSAAVAPSADLVCWSRIGSRYKPADLVALLEDRSLVEFRGMIRPGADIVLFRADMRDWPGREPLREWQIGQRAWVGANDACRQEILQRLRSEGPSPARELPDTCAVTWHSTGWTSPAGCTPTTPRWRQTKRGSCATSAGWRRWGSRGASGRNARWSRWTSAAPGNPP